MNIESSIQLLKDHGYKTTARRKAIIDFFIKAGGYRTAKEVTSFMALHYKGISYDTVYRNLHLYVDLGILEATELNGEKHFQITCQHGHHHHFICRICGNTKEIDLCPMDNLGQSLANFQIEDHKFEVYGLCPECS